MPPSENEPKNKIWKKSWIEVIIRLYLQRKSSIRPLGVIIFLRNKGKLISIILEFFKNWPELAEICMESHDLSSTKIGLSHD